MKFAAALLRDWPLLPYNLALLVSSPIVLLLKAWRYWKKGWKREYDLRRWLVPVHREPAKDSNVPHVVLVATGWGEMRLAALLDAALKEKVPRVRTTWVLRDGEAAQAASHEFPRQAISFLPFDFINPACSSVAKLSPDVVVFIEKFWFPNFVRVCRDYGSKLVVVNARTRAHKSARYKMFGPFHRWIGGSFHAFTFQSTEDLQRAARVLSPRAKASAPGNLKFALRPTPDASKAQSLSLWLGADKLPILAAGSLEEGDLQFMLDAFDAVRARTRCCLLVAPRRLHQVDELCAELRQRGYRISLRSQPAAPHAEQPDAQPTDIFLLDTMGELAAAYQFATAAFIGGTLKVGAGHNIVEPLAFGAPVSYGPNRGFFESVQRVCEETGVGLRVNQPAELADHWTRVLEDEQMREEVKVRAAQLLAAQAQTLQVNVVLLAEILEEQGNYCR